MPLRMWWKKENSAIQNSTISFLFIYLQVEKKLNLGNNPKIGYDNIDIKTVKFLTSWDKDFLIEENFS